MIRVLVVEPDPLYRKLFPIWIRDHFGQEAIEVETAKGVLEALAAVDRSRPDVLLTAFELEGLDGLRLAKRMRARIGVLPVIVVAQTAYLRLQRRLAHSPETYYLAKPVGEETFTSTVELALREASPKDEAGAT